MESFCHEVGGFYATTYEGHVGLDFFYKSLARSFHNAGRRRFAYCACAGFSQRKDISVALAVYIKGDVATSDFLGRLVYGHDVYLVGVSNLVLQVFKIGCVKVLCVFERTHYVLLKEYFVYIAVEISKHTFPLSDEKTTAFEVVAMRESRFEKLFEFRYFHKHIFAKTASLYA